MTDDTTTQQPEPSDKIRELGERMVGTWRMSGGVTGTVRFEWLDGGFFLLQHVDLEQSGMQIRGLEVIGHEHPFGGEPSEDIKSRFYDNQGNTLDYVYELDGDTLTIWGGEKGSPAYARSTYSADGTSSSGAWVYPGGGGYEFTVTRVAE